MAESLKERLRTDLNEARRGRDKLRTTVLTTLLSDVRNREIDSRAGGGKDPEGGELGDAAVVELVGSAIKRRREAAEQMRAGGREELAAKEEREAELLAEYLPPQLDEAEVRRTVREAIAAGADNVGAVMASVMPRIKGRFDGREANRIAREELDASG